MLTFLKAAARYARYAFAEKAAKRADLFFANAWRSALEREQRVRDIIGAERSESTTEAAWRVAGKRDQ